MVCTHHREERENETATRSPEGHINRISQCQMLIAGCLPLPRTARIQGMLQPQPIPRTMAHHLDTLEKATTTSRLHPLMVSPTSWHKVDRSLNSIHHLERMDSRRYRQAVIHVSKGVIHATQGMAASPSMIQGMPILVRQPLSHPWLLRDGSQSQAPSSQGSHTSPVASLKFNANFGSLYGQVPPPQYEQYGRRKYR